MKGIILAGGKATRMYPLTYYLSKHILPVYDKPMIYYPLTLLIEMNIDDIMIVCNQRDIDIFKNQLSNLNEAKINIEYAVQSKPDGIASALLLGEKFADKDGIVLILGDNFFHGNSFVKTLIDLKLNNEGATILGYKVSNPSEFGVVEFDRFGNVQKIVEKPVSTNSNYIVPGLYFYTNDVFYLAKSLMKSDRGEYEISDLNNLYLQSGKLKVQLLDDSIYWSDMGTFDNLLKVSNFISTHQRKTKELVSSVEGVAFKMGKLSEEKIKEISKMLGLSSYGAYLEMLRKTKKGEG